MKSEKIRNIVTTVLFCGFLLLFFAWGLLKPDDALSSSERRPLEQFPELSAQTVLSGALMEKLEDYSVDQFPLRDDFRTLKSITQFYVLAQKDNNGVYLADGHASKLEYPLNEESVEYAAQRLGYIYETYLKDAGITPYLCIIPDKNCFMAQENGYPSIDFDELEALMLENTEFAEYIDIYDLLELGDYYTTDIHWRQDKIVDVAQRLAQAMGVPFEGDFDKVVLDIPFYGVYYGQSALPLKPDELSYLTNAAIEGAHAFDYETNSDMPVYSMELAGGRDPYEMFLGGSKSLITIENPDALSDKELIIFRDSFGSSLTPLLIESYSKITVIDIRYIMSSNLGMFVDFDNQDVLFMYSLPVLNNSSTIK